jgi:hypothetical protein
MRIPLKVAIIIGLALAGTPASSAAVSQQPASGQQSGLMLMRQVLTIQANKPFAKAGYGSLSDVLKMMPMTRGVAPEAAQAVHLTDAETADVGDYTLRLTRSEDRAKFELSLVPKQSCDVAFFSNDRNIVYTGRALGCSDK